MNGNGKNNGAKKPYLKPEMKVEKISRFFFSMCSTSIRMCYSQYISDIPLCRLF